MKLLIVTQVLDTEHPILGFFHRWVEEFAAHCEEVHVICLQEGRHHLPANVHVHSLGKEQGAGTFMRVLRFYRFIWQLRREYDAVFVHMNQVYILLGGLLWRLWGKRVSLWSAHGSTPRSLHVALTLTDVVFTCSPESFRIASDKVRVVGHGIDTSRFTPRACEKDIDLITVGRITPAKDLMALVDMLHIVRAQHAVTLTIVGSALTDAEKTYEAQLRTYVAEQGLAGAVRFIGSVNQPDLPAVLSRAKVFVTAAKNGSLDKAMLEAMACGLPIVSSAPGSVSLPLGGAQVTTREECAAQVASVLESSKYLRQEYVDFVQREHALPELVRRIFGTL